MRDEDWEEIDLRATSAIKLNLAKNVIVNVHEISTSKDLWKKLEAKAKNISNQLYLKS